MEPLEYEIPSLLRYEVEPESPVIDPPRPSIRINARNVRYDGERLTFELLATYCFPRDYFAWFRKLSRALVCALEDAAGARAVLVPAVDPHKTYPDDGELNFQGVHPIEQPPRRWQKGWFCMPLEVPLPLPPSLGSSFFVTCFLHEHVSNTLAFDLHAVRQTSYLNGEPFEIQAEETLDAEELETGEEEEEEDSAGPSAPFPAPSPRRVLTVTARQPGAHAPGEPVLLDAELALRPEELESIGAEGWLRSIFISSVDQAGTVGEVAHWLGDRLVFAGDWRRGIVDGEERMTYPLSFELATVVGDPVPAGVFHVHVSARQYCSNVLELICP